MLVGLIVANTIAFGVSMLLIKKSIIHYLRHQLLDISTTLLLSVLLGAVVYLFNFTHYQYLIKLIVEAVCFSLFYLIAVRIVYKERWMEAKDGIIKKVRGFF